MKILVIEDDQLTNDFWCLELFRQNFSVDSSVTFESAIKNLSQNKYDLIILDMELNADFNAGSKIINFLNKRNNITDIILISGKNFEDLMINYSDIFWFTKKPCLKKELKFIIDKWLLSKEKPNWLKFKEFKYNLQEDKLFKNNILIHISPKQSQIFIKLLEAGGKLVTKDELINLNFATKEDINVYIFNLRKILGQNSILTVRKQGWKLNNHEAN